MTGTSALLSGDQTPANLKRVQHNKVNCIFVTCKISLAEQE